MGDREPHQFHDLYRVNVETGERKLIFLDFTGFS